MRVPDHSLDDTVWPEVVGRALRGLPVGTRGRSIRPNREGPGRRAMRVEAHGLLKVKLAQRNGKSMQPMAVRDVSFFGLGLVRELPLPLTCGQLVHMMIDFDGYRDLRPVHGALLHARVRRRRPDREGFFLGVEVDDLRGMPWKSLASFIEMLVEREG